MTGPNPLMMLVMLATVVCLTVFWLVVADDEDES